MTQDLEQQRTDNTDLAAVDISQTNAITAIVSLKERIICYTAIITSGVCGALCAYGTAALFTEATIWKALAIIFGASGAAFGVSVPVRLSLQAKLEWNSSENPT